MKKVLYIFDSLKRGGAETSTLEIAAKMHEWTPVILSIYKGTELREDFEKKGIKVYSLNEKSQLSIISTQKKIQEVIKDESPDLIHSNLFMADQFARFLGEKYNIPVVNSFVNDSYSPKRKELLSFKQKISLAFYQYIDRFTASRVTKFISLTEAIIENNVKALGVNPSQVEVIHRGRDLHAMRQKVNLGIVQEIRNTYGSGSIILTVSRLLIRKGYLDSIKAMKKVIEVYPDVKYLIVGWGHDRPLIEALIKELSLENHVFLLGNRNDVPSLLEAADIFLFPSHYEGQGGALIEAMLMGKGIVATKIPVLEESVKDNYSAVLFEYRNIKDMARKIIWSLDHPETMKNYGKNAMEEAQKKFCINNIAAQQEALYEEVYSQAKEK